MIFALIFKMRWLLGLETKSDDRNASAIMTKLLVLAYHFPPIGGGGVQRNAKFVRYLPEHGFDALVVTGPGNPRDRWTPADVTLLDDVSGLADIRRVPGPEPAPEQGLRSKLEWRLMLKTSFIRWWLDGALRLGRDVVRDVDLIYASLVPYDTAEAAATLARESGKPWVADLQDPWALDEMWLYPSRLHRRLDVRRMRKLLGTAAGIVMNTPEASARLLRAFPELHERIVVSIPNGFDASDFAGPLVSHSDGRFRIVHTGYLHTETGLRLRRMRRLRRLVGGMTERVDILPRSHVYLLQALERLAAEDPKIVSRIDLVLAGVTSPLDRRIADASPVSAKMLGYLPHSETVSLMRSADLLFLPMHDLPAGTRAGLVPGKTYEYLASQRPILAAVGEGDARDLLLEAGNATVCAPTDEEAMASAIREHLRNWESGRATRAPRPNVLARYERRHLTQHLADVFDQVLESSRGVYSAAPHTGEDPKLLRRATG